MATYQPATREPHERVERMLEKFHQPLRDAEIRIDVLMAYPGKNEHGDITSPAVTCNGYKCQAKVRIVSLRDRSKGMGDAEITIDSENWEELADAERDALIDHELEHLELKYDKDALLVRDDLGRPRLVLRKHDHQFGWFDSIARRHGRSSLEVQQYDVFREANKQLWLPFGPDDEIPQSGGRMPVKEPTPEEVAAAAAEEGTTVTLSAGGKSVTMSSDKFKEATAGLATAARKTRKKATQAEETQLAQAGG